MKASLQRETRIYHVTANVAGRDLWYIATLYRGGDGQWYYELIKDVSDGPHNGWVRIDQRSAVAAELMVHIRKLIAQEGRPVLPSAQAKALDAMKHALHVIAGPGEHPDRAYVANTMERLHGAIAALGGGT